MSKRETVDLGDGLNQLFEERGKFQPTVRFFL